MLLQRAEEGVQEGGGVSAGKVHGGRFGGIASGQRDSVSHSQGRRQPGI